MADLLTHCIAVAVVCFGTDPGSPSGASCTPMQIRVWDGDSMRLGLTSDAEAVRIQGIDTPEMEGRCLAERMLARIAKQVMCNGLNGSTVVVQRNSKRPKDAFRRTLADLCVKNGDSCNDVGKQMIDQGYAVPWGGRRESWCDGQSRPQKRSS